MLNFSDNCSVEKHEKIPECDVRATVDALAKQLTLAHQGATWCPGGTQMQSEAIVMTLCAAPSPVRWKPGIKVTLLSEYYTNHWKDVFM